MRNISASLITTITSHKNVERIPAIIALMGDLRVDSYRVQGMMPFGQTERNYGCRRKG